MTGTILETARLRLEPFAVAHLEGLQAMAGDPLVMRHITGVATREQTAAGIERTRRSWAEFGFGWWSFFEQSSGELVGAGCIQHLARDPANPLEIGWRLRPDRWGRGLASEAGRAMAAFAFDRLGISVLLAVAMPENSASRRVMERLGMRYRGIERWYDLDLATYELGAAEWRAVTAPPP
jgi:RimJ/RimL family protein N-acetyltransferase